MKPYLACILTTILPALAFGQAIIRPANTGGDVAFGSIDSGAITADGPLTLTCTACSPALAITGVASGENAVVIPGGAFVCLNPACTASLRDSATAALTFTATGGVFFNNTTSLGSAVYNITANNGGSLAFNDPTRWLSTTTALLESSTAATSGTDTAFTLKPLNALDAADKVLDVQTNDGTSQFNVTANGTGTFNGTVNATTFAAYAFAAKASTSGVLSGRFADGASAVGVKLGNITTLTTAGSKVAAFCADNPAICASEVASIAHDGTVTTAAGVSAAGTVSAANVTSSGYVETNALQTASGGNLAVTVGDELGASGVSFALGGAGTGLRTRTETVTFAADPGDASKSTSTLIPAGVILQGITARVVIDGTTCTSIDLGDGTDADRFGDDIAVATNTTVTPANATADPTGWASGVRNVVVTANGGNCVGLQIVVAAHYLELSPPAAQ